LPNCRQRFCQNTSDDFQRIYCLRTATERINSQALDLGIERPHLRNGRSIANLKHVDLCAHQPARLAACAQAPYAAHGKGHVGPDRLNNCRDAPGAGSFWHALDGGWFGHEPAWRRYSVGGSTTDLSAAPNLSSGLAMMTRPRLRKTQLGNLPHDLITKAHPPFSRSVAHRHDSFQ
jgi:hypothetical protein